MKRTPLKRFKGLDRTSGLRSIGAKQRRDRNELAQVRPAVLKRGCEFNNYMTVAPHVRANLVSNPPITCAGVLAAHHAVRRSQGGSNHPSNLICLCRRHHDWVHLYPATSVELGLLR